MFRHFAQKKSSSVVALLLACMLLAMAPFAAALEIHHELAAADHDGHDHSLAGDVPAPCAFLADAPPQSVRAPILISQSLPASRASRAPPLT